MVKRQHIHEAMKSKDPSDFDLDEKGRLMKILKTYFDMPALTGEVIYIDRNTNTLARKGPEGCHSKEEVFAKYHVHNPDLLIKTTPNPTIIEIDGPVHWQNSHAVKNTNRRNEHYEAAGIPYLWLTRDEVRKNSTTELVNRLAVWLQKAPNWQAALARSVN